MTTVRPTVSHMTKEARMVVRGSTVTHQFLRARLTLLVALTLVVDAIGTVLMYWFEAGAKGSDFDDLGGALFWVTARRRGGAGWVGGRMRRRRLSRPRLQFWSRWACCSSRVLVADASCAGEVKKIAERYWEPMSTPWRLRVVGSWAAQKRSSSSS